MPTPTYTPLANITLGSTATSVTFSSITGLYRDLVLVVTGKTTTNGNSFVMRINSDAGSNYNRVSAFGSGSSASSSNSSGDTYLFGSVGIATSNTEFFISTTNFMDYSATDKHKPILTRTDLASATYPGTEMIASRWASTSAITSITIGIVATWSSGSTFALYGIAA